MYDSNMHGERIKIPNCLFGQVIAVCSENRMEPCGQNAIAGVHWPQVVTIVLLRFNPLNPELNLICYLLALLAHHFLHVSKLRVKLLTFRLLMSYIYGAPILDVSRSYTTTQHSR